MIFKTKDEILNWLEKYDRNYQENMEKNAYEFIDIHDSTNQILFKEMMNKEHLTHHYCENLKSEDHQYIINVKNSVDISRKKLEIIPIQFYDVDGYFSCIHNQLTSLRGCPQYVGDSFFCQYNQLTSLKYSPQHINGHFFCHHNQLTSLEYFPEIVTKGVYLENNEKLLKYKKESNDINIKNMSNDEFLQELDFKFWKQFNLQEKAKNENSQILDDLILYHKIEQNHSALPKVKKV